MKEYYTLGELCWETCSSRQKVLLRAERLGIPDKRAGNGWRIYTEEQKTAIVAAIRAEDAAPAVSSDG